LKPKKVIPIVTESGATGMMRERSDYFRARTNLSILKPHLSPHPLQEIQIPKFSQPPTFGNPK
jgi:hypothetical protein